MSRTETFHSHMLGVVEKLSWIVAVFEILQSGFSNSVLGPHRTIESAYGVKTKFEFWKFCNRPRANRRFL
jgi:hypothetical protein